MPAPLRPPRARRSSLTTGNGQSLDELMALHARLGDGDLLWPEVPRDLRCRAAGGAAAACGVLGTAPLTRATRTRWRAWSRRPPTARPPSSVGSSSHQPVAELKAATHATARPRQAAGEAALAHACCAAGPGPRPQRRLRGCLRRPVGARSPRAGGAGSRGSGRLRARGGSARWLSARVGGWENENVGGAVGARCAARRTTWLRWRKCTNKDGGSGDVARVTS